MNELEKKSGKKPHINLSLLSNTCEAILLMYHEWARSPAQMLHNMLCYLALFSALHAGIYSISWSHSSVKTQQKCRQHKAAWPYSSVSSPLLTRLHHFQRCRKVWQMGSSSISINWIKTNLAAGAMVINQLSGTRVLVGGVWVHFTRMGQLRQIMSRYVKNNVVLQNTVNIRLMWLKTSPLHSVVQP